MAQNQLFFLVLLLGIVARGLSHSCSCGTPGRPGCPNYEPSWCLGGIVKDTCDCCYVCAQGPGDECTTSTSPFPEGTCGHDLKCVERSTGQGGVCRRNLFTGPTDKIWSDDQCDNIGRSYGLSLSECKLWCRNTPSCSALNYMNENHPDSRLNHSESGCNLRNCPIPIPTPDWNHHPYQGYSLNTGSPSWTSETKGCITGHNKLEKYYISSLAACKLECESQIGFVCKSIEYNAGEDRCVLSESTRLSSDYLETCNINGWTYTEIVMAGSFLATPWPIDTSNNGAL